PVAVCLRALSDPRALVTVGLFRVPGDHAFLRASTFLFALGFLAASWLGDALAAWADPRLRRPTHAGGAT
ncbi:MAG: hypothetical protein ACPGQD_09035, partial [Planctomycetota bacterium]